MEWLKFISDATLRTMYADLLAHGSFDYGPDAEITKAALLAIEREAGQRTMGITKAPEAVK